MNEWDRCKHWIEAALQYADGTHTLEDIRQGIAEDRFQLWTGEKSAIVTEILTYPRKKAVNFFLIGGDLDELKLMEPVICEWAKHKGCDRSIGIGRKGLMRVFADAGYQPRWQYIAKELAVGGSNF